MALIDLIPDHKIISIVGLAKNTGKTVVLNKLLEESESRKISFGITSIGHDGEEFDQINHSIKKPRIFLKKGDVVGTTDKLIEKSSAKVEIVRKTDFQTSLGVVLIGRIVREGNIEIAGPSTAKKIRQVCEIMLEYGAKKILVDGAVDRKAISSPVLSDGCIISTGAVLNSDIDRVVIETKNIIRQFLLPEIDNLEIKRLGLQSRYSLTIARNGGIIELEEETLLDNHQVIIQQLSDDIEYIIIKKVLNESLLEDLVKVKKKRNPLTLVISDSTKLFISQGKLDYFEKKGILIRVMIPSRIIAITVNPVYPLSYRFDSNEFIEKMEHNIPDIPVYDVLSENYR